MKRTRLMKASEEEPSGSGGWTGVVVSTAKRLQLATWIRPTGGSGGPRAEDREVRPSRPLERAGAPSPASRGSHGPKGRTPGTVRTLGPAESHMSGGEALPRQPARAPHDFASAPPTQGPAKIPGNACGTTGIGPGTNGPARGASRSGPAVGQGRETAELEYRSGCERGRLLDPDGLTPGELKRGPGRIRSTSRQGRLGERVRAGAGDIHGAVGRVCPGHHRARHFKAAPQG